MEAVAGVVPNCVTVAVPPIVSNGHLRENLTILTRFFPAGRWSLRQGDDCKADKKRSTRKGICTMDANIGKHSQTHYFPHSQYLRFGMLGTDFCFYCLDAISMVLSGTAPQLYIPEVTWEHTLQRTCHIRACVTVSNMFSSCSLLRSGQNQPFDSSQQ